MENPNEYDDEGYTKGCVETQNAVSLMWDSGATLDQIAEEIRNAFDNEGLKVEVSLI